MPSKKQAPQLRIMPVPLVDLRKLVEYEQHCSTRERLILDADAARDLLLECWRADGEGRTSRGRVGVWIAGIEKAGAVDLPADDVMKICSTIRDADACA